MLTDDAGVRLNAEWYAIRADAERLMERAVRFGAMVWQAIEPLPPSGRRKWIETHCEFSYATARNYIKLAEKSQSNALDWKSVRHLYPSGRPHPNLASPRPALSRPEPNDNRAAYGINEHHTKAMEALKERLQHIVNCGSLLETVSAEFPGDDEFNGWVRENCSFNPDVAGLYVLLATAASFGISLPQPNLDSEQLVCSGCGAPATCQCGVTMVQPDD